LYPHPLQGERADSAKLSGERGRFGMGTAVGKLAATRRIQHDHHSRERHSGRRPVPPTACRESGVPDLSRGGGLKLSGMGLIERRAVTQITERLGAVFLVFPNYFSGLSFFSEQFPSSSLDLLNRLIANV
jgi:hypothetical protein